MLKLIFPSAFSLTFRYLIPILTKKYFYYTKVALLLVMLLLFGEPGHREEISDEVWGASGPHPCSISLYYLHVPIWTNHSMT